jgi:hypothetical protein
MKEHNKTHQPANPGQTPNPNKWQQQQPQQNPQHPKKEEKKRHGGC